MNRSQNPGLCGHISPEKRRRHAGSFIRLAACASVLAGLTDSSLAAPSPAAASDSLKHLSLAELRTVAEVGRVIRGVTQGQAAGGGK